MKKSLLLLTFILLTYSGYAQNKLYKNDSVVITATKITYPGGITPFVIDTTGKPDYTDFSSIGNWSLYGGGTSLTTKQVKDEIDTLVTAKTFAACTDAEKDVASEWFVVDKSDRDTRHNAAQQEKNAEELCRNLLPKAPEGEIIKYRDAIKNESADNITNAISNLGKSLIWLSSPVNKVSGAPTIVFTDIDISNDTGADIAHTAIFSIKITKSVSDAHRDIFMRKNGSTLTDNSIPSLGSEVKTGSHIHGQLHVPLDDSEICEYKANANGDTTVDITLLGYIK